MNDRSVLDNSLDKKKDWLEKLHKTLKESQHSTRACEKKSVKTNLLW